MLGLLGLIPGKGKLVLMLGLALAVTAAVGYHFYKVNSLNSELVTAVADLTQAKANQAILEDAVSELKQSQELLETQRKIDQAKITELGRNYRASRQKVGDLRKMLSKHDLGNLMLEKPGLIENRMNNATERLGAELEELTNNE